MHKVCLFVWLIYTEFKIIGWYVVFSHIVLKTFCFVQPLTTVALFLHCSGTLKSQGDLTRSRRPTGPSWFLWEGPACAISGWCEDSDPCEDGVKASLPFHGALIWPFHWVKPKENPCPWPLWRISPLWHRKRKKKISSWLGMKRAGPCAHRTHDPWTLTFRKGHKGENKVESDWKSNIGIVSIAPLMWGVPLELGHKHTPLLKPSHFVLVLTQARR